MIRKICFCVPDLEYGGSSEVVINLANEFSARGYGVFIVSAYDFVAGKYKGLINESNIAFYSCHKRSRFDLSFIKRLKEIISFIKPDVISSHLSMTVYVSAIDKTTRIFHTIHSNPKKEFVSLVRFYLSHRSNVYFIACSNSVFDLARKIYKRRLCVVQNGLSNENKVGNELSLTKKNIDFLYVGRFDKVKCISDLVKAFAILHGENSALKLCLCGSGAEEKKIIKTIKKCKLPDDSVMMPGYVDNVSAYYARSKVFCLFSSREGGPMCLLEASSFGLPIVCTDIPGNLNYVNDQKSALTFKTHNYKAASYLMKRIINDERLYGEMAKCSLQTAKDNSFKDVANKYLEIMNHVER